MLEQDFPIGNYLTGSDVNLDNYSRQQIVLLIEDLYEVKQYKVETLYLAVSIADRYLVKVFQNGRELPCLLTLSIIVLIMAAKIEEPIAPSVLRMIDLLHEQH